METSVGIRELLRNPDLLAQYDYLDIEDKRSHKYKGLFVAPKYAREMKEYLRRKIAGERQRDLKEIMDFAGIVDGDFQEMTTQAATGRKIERYED